MRDQLGMFEKPIFLDQTGMRWKLLRVILFGVAAGLSLLPLMLAFSILKVEILPDPSVAVPQPITVVYPPRVAQILSRRPTSYGLNR
jgi:hypothetical protein